MSSPRVRCCKGDEEVQDNPSVASGTQSVIYSYEHSIAQQLSCRPHIVGNGLRLDKAKSWHGIVDH